ncbi:C-X-C motif chemokine 11-6-like, partial [Clarias magur]
MKSAAVFVVFACLLIEHVQGQANRPSRCLCQGPLANVVRIQRIDKIEVYPTSASCENVEIIVTLKNGVGKKCLNPKSEFTQKYITTALGKGQANRPSRCLCQGPLANVVRIQRIDKIEVYPTSASCENVEIIVTLKNDAGRKCLNPKSEFTQKYIKTALEK